MKLTQSLACPHCGKTPRNEHSLREGGICDGLRSGKIKKLGDRLLQSHDGADVVPRKRTRKRVVVAVTDEPKGKKR